MSRVNAAAAKATNASLKYRTKAFSADESGRIISGLKAFVPSLPVNDRIKGMLESEKDAFLAVGMKIRYKDLPACRRNALHFLSGEQRENYLDFLLELSKDCILAGSFAEAENALSPVLVSAPANWHALAQAANINTLTGKYKLAIEYAEKADAVFSGYVKEYEVDAIDHRTVAIMRAESRTMLALVEGAGNEALHESIRPVFCHQQYIDRVKAGEGSIVQLRGKLRSAAENSANRILAEMKKRGLPLETFAYVFGKPFEGDLALELTLEALDAAEGISYEPVFAAFNAVEKNLGRKAVALLVCSRSDTVLSSGDKKKVSDFSEELKRLKKDKLAPVPFLDDMLELLRHEAKGLREQGKKDAAARQVDAEVVRVKAIRASIIDGTFDLKSGYREAARAIMAVLPGDEKGKIWDQTLEAIGKELRKNGGSEGFSATALFVDEFAADRGALAGLRQVYRDALKEKEIRTKFVETIISARKEAVKLNTVVSPLVSKTAPGVNPTDKKRYAELEKIHDLLLLGLGLGNAAIREMFAEYDRSATEAIPLAAVIYGGHAMTAAQVFESASVGQKAKLIRLMIDAYSSAIAECKKVGVVSYFFSVEIAAQYTELNEWEKSEAALEEAESWASAGKNLFCFLRAQNIHLSNLMWMIEAKIRENNLREARKLAANAEASFVRAREGYEKMPGKLAVISRLVNDFPRALEYGKTALEADPYDTNVIYEMVRSLLLIGDFRRMIDLTGEKTSSFISNMEKKKAEKKRKKELEKRMARDISEDAAPAEQAAVEEEEFTPDDYKAFVLINMYAEALFYAGNYQAAIKMLGEKSRPGMGMLIKARILARIGNASEARRELHAVEEVGLGAKGSAAEKAAFEANTLAAKADIAIAEGKIDDAISLYHKVFARQAVLPHLFPAEAASRWQLIMAYAHWATGDMDGEGDDVKFVEKKKYKEMRALVEETARKYPYFMPARERMMVFYLAEAKEDELFATLKLLAEPQNNFAFTLKTFVYCIMLSTFTDLDGYHEIKEFILSLKEKLPPGTFAEYCRDSREDFCMTMPQYKDAVPADIMEFLGWGADAAGHS